MLAAALAVAGMPLALASSALAIGSPNEDSLFALLRHRAYLDKFLIRDLEEDTERHDNSAFYQSLQAMQASPESEAKLRELIHHYRPRYRQWAREKAESLGFTDLPAFDPVRSMTLHFENELRIIAGLVPTRVPPDAPWVHVRVPDTSRIFYRFELSPEAFESGERPHEVSGWLLAQTGEEVRLLDFTGFERVVDAKIATITSRGLKNEIGTSPTGLRVSTAVLPAAWALVRGDRQTAAALALPAFAEAYDTKPVLDEFAVHIARGLHTRVDWAFRIDRDYERAVAVAALLADPRYAAYGKRDGAARLAAELSDPAKTSPDLFLITKDEWTARRASMSRAEQIDFLIAMMRAKTPPGVTVRRPIPRTEWVLLEPDQELRDLDLGPGDFATLVRHLGDDRHVPSPVQSDSFSLTSLRDFDEPGGAWTVGSKMDFLIANQANGRIFDWKAYRDADAASRAAIEANIVEWAKAHTEMSKEDIALEQLGKLSVDDDRWELAAQALTGSHDPRVIPFLIEKGTHDPQWRERGASKIYRFDSAETVPAVRAWLAEANEDFDALSEESKLASAASCHGCNTRLAEALHLLRRGDRANLEGLDTIRSVVERDFHGHEYATAWEDLWNLERPETAALLLTVLDKPSVADNFASINDYLPCRIWMTRQRRLVDILQERLKSAVRREDGYVRWGNRKDPTDGDRIAEMIAKWAEHSKSDIAMKYDFDEPEVDRAAKREVLSGWLEEQFALAAAGKPDLISIPCSRNARRLADLGPVP